MKTCDGEVSIPSLRLDLPVIPAKAGIQARPPTAEPPRAPMAQQVPFAQLGPEAPSV